MKSLMMAVILFATCLSWAQNCDGIINDEAGILRDPSALSQGVRPLIDEGADVKIVTVASISKYGANLKAVEDTYESRCPSWKSPSGGRKANLFVFMVAPANATQKNTKNIFFGDAYKPILPTEDSVNVIYSRSANPYFANKQWEQGFAAAGKEFAAKIVAYHDQRQHPATTVVEATDLSGLWWFMRWLLIFAFIGGLVLCIYLVLKTRRARKDATINAQAEAMDEWNRANEAYLAMDKTNPRYAAISKQYLDMGNSIRFNPNEDLSLADYRISTRAWRDLRLSINAENLRNISEAPSSQAKRSHKPTPRKSEPPVQASQSAPIRETVSQPAPIRETVVVREGTNDLVTGMLINEALHSHRDPEPERYREPEPTHYRDPDPEPEPEPSRASSGSDSTWSSSDTDNNSSGSESIFDSGGSGGGSGSDSDF